MYGFNFRQNINFVNVSFRKMVGGSIYYGAGQNTIAIFWPAGQNTIRVKILSDTRKTSTPMNHPSHHKLLCFVWMILC